MWEGLFYLKGNKFHLFFWDWKSTLDWDDIEILKSVLESYKSPTIVGINTGGDDYGIAIGERPIDKKEAQEFYEYWVEHGFK